MKQLGPATRFRIAPLGVETPIDFHAVSAKGVMRNLSALEGGSAIGGFLQLIEFDAGTPLADS